MPKIPGYLTIHEVAKALDVSHSAAARYIRRKLLKGVIDIGGQRLVPQKSLDGFKKPEPGNPNWKRRKRKSA